MDNENLGFIPNNEASFNANKTLTEAEIKKLKNKRIFLIVLGIVLDVIIGCGLIFGVYLFIYNSISAAQAGFDFDEFDRASKASFAGFGIAAFCIATAIPTNVLCFTFAFKINCKIKNPNGVKKIQTNVDSLSTADIPTSEMYMCPNCGDPIDYEEEYCSKCGAKIVKVCPNCGTHNEHYNKFCKKCGSKL